MQEALKRHVRTAQTYFPAIRTIKPVMQDIWARACRRPFEPDFRALSLFRPAPGQLFLDIGANRGQSITALRLTTKRPVTVSFEANSALAGALMRRYKDDPDATIHAVGLGEQPGKFTLFIPSYRGYQFDGLASLDLKEAMGWLNETTIVGFDPKHLGCTAVDCAVRTLDSFGLSPFFAKIDVQGFELDVLMGGNDTLARHEPVLLIETPSAGVYTYLTRFGYRPYRYSPQGKSFAPGVGEQNTFFMTENKFGMLRGNSHAVRAGSF